MNLDVSIKIGLLVFVKKNLDNLAVYNMDKTEYTPETTRSK